jgi:hypothetical protein
MKIERNTVKEGTIEEFAELYDLVMCVSERVNPSRPSARFYARFKACEVKDGAALISTFGNGLTEEKAIANYAHEISTKLLVFHAMDNKKRREIRAWRFCKDGS